MKLDSGGFAAFLKAFEALPEGEKQEAVAFADKVCAGMRFVPNVGPQTDAYFSLADELFYGGAGGGGKTHLLCGVAVNCHHDIQLFRREAVQLRGIIKALTEIIGSTDGLNMSPPPVWRLPTGQTIEMAGVKDEKDKFDWQGRAADLKGFDEITAFTRSQYRFIIGWNRSTRPGQRCRVIATGNPPMDENGLWVIQHWAPWLDETHSDPALPGELRWPVRAGDDDEDKEIFFRTKEEAIAHLETLSSAPRDFDGTLIPPRSRTFIPAKLEDNPDLMRSGYAAVLEAMPKELRDAMRHGRFKSTFQDDEFQVIPTEWIMQAQARWTPQKPQGSLMSAMGVDIAQGGADRTVIAPRYGEYYPNLIVKPGKDTPDGPTAAALIIIHLRDAASINIDLGGGWGGSAYDHLKSNAVSLVGIVPGGASQGRTVDGRLTFKNIRAEMWWRFREALDPASQYAIALPPDPELRSELAAPKWKLTSGNAIQLEEKIDIKKRLGRSPDKGDAVVMAWWTGDNKRRRSAERATRYADLPTMANLGGSRKMHSQRLRQPEGGDYGSSSYKDEQG